MATFWQDLRYGVRLLLRSPAFSIAAVLTVAIGIAATTAMFSVVYGVLLRPLPYAEPDRLVNIWSTAPSRGLQRAYVAMANVFDWKARNHVFADIASARAIANFNLAGQDAEPERLLGARISANMLPVLGVTPLLGRNFTEDEDTIGHDHVALLSYGLWRRRFGGDVAVVGRDISLSGIPHTVVGVMRPDFAFPSRDYQIWTPHTFDPDELRTRVGYNYLAVARVKPGVTLDQVNGDLAAIMAQLEREFPFANTGIGAMAVPVLADTVEAVRTALYVLLAAVVAMLLIGCANLANLLASRALTRQRELAVRAALGASQARLVGQSIAELLPVIAAGGACGIVLGAWTIDALVPMLPPDLPRAENIAVSWPVVAWGIFAIAVITVLVGAWPAVEARRAGLATMTADSSRAVTGGVRRSRMRDALVVSQIAATLWLAVTAAVLGRSFTRLRNVDPGFTPDGAYSVHLAIPRTKYRTDRAIADLMARIVDRVEGLPGVVAAGMVNRLPLAGGAQTAGIEFEGIDRSVVSELGLQSDLRPVTPHYFQALGIPVLRGRAFTEADDERAQPVGIIDDRVARTIFRGADPIGRRFRPVLPGDPRPWVTIVGVVGHVRHDRLDEDGRPQTYWNYRQNTQDREALVVRTAGDPAALGPAIAGAVHSVDPEQPLYDARPLQAVVDRSLAQRSFQTTLLAAFAAVAILLASIGVYGVIAFGVGQRRREFGVRLALGAARAEIVSLAMRRGALMFAGGAALGLLLSAATSRVLAALLYEVAPLDPLSVSAATALLLLVALLAGGLPALRAGQLDPAITLRAE